ncbi:MAG: hypothetical protein LUG50_10915 [Planctomycetaceae bacterium]|nr:hypothetical protein [Planctomycetaceae bacterium]
MNVSSAASPYSGFVQKPYEARTTPAVPEKLTFRRDKLKTQSEYERNPDKYRQYDTWYTSADAKKIGLDLSLQNGGPVQVELAPMEEEPKPFNARNDRTPEEFAQVKKDFKEKLGALVDAKNDLDSHVQAVMRKAGINLSSADGLRLEVGSDGTIYAGGIKDPKKRKAVEAALNKEKGLAKKIQEHAKDMRSLNATLREETILDMNILGRVAAGEDINLYGLGLDKLPNLEMDLDSELQAFELFSGDPEMVDLLKEYTGASRVTVTADASANADPEGTLRKLGKDAKAGIQRAFDGYNDRLAETMGAAGAFDDEFMAKHSLDLSGVSITVDSNHQIVIEGTVADDPRSDAEGKRIIEEAMQEMMAQQDDTWTYSVFDEAAGRALMECSDSFGPDAAPDAAVVLEIGANAPGGSVRLSSPEKEQEIREDVALEVNTLLSDMDIDVGDGFEVDVDENGTITITNLPEDELEREKILQALEMINSGVKNADTNDKTYGALRSLLDHHAVFQDGGINAIREAAKKSAEEPGESGEVTETAYGVAAKSTVTRADTTPTPAAVRERDENPLRLMDQETRVDVYA